MNLNEQPEIVNWPETHYVFVEKTGPFPVSAPEAWREAHTWLAGLREANRITGFMSLYKMAPRIYRAGFAVAERPAELPAALRYEKFSGGTFSRFTLTGPYTQLPDASRRVFEIVSAKPILLRDDFCIENYVNNPETTPENQLITEILVPGIPG